MAKFLEEVAPAARTKTALFWLRKRARTPKMIGLATAAGSVHTIATMVGMANRGEGKFYVVDCLSAAHGRAIIKADGEGLRDGSSQARHGIVSRNGNVHGLGANAVLAIAGASAGARTWDARLARQGVVTVEQTRALADVNVGAVNVLDAFGEGFK